MLTAATSIVLRLYEILKLLIIYRKFLAGSVTTHRCMQWYHCLHDSGQCCEQDDKSARISVWSGAGNYSGQQP